MKTSVHIDKQKIETARKLTGVATMKELLDKALDAYIAQARRLTMSEMLGTDFFGGDLKKMRKKNASSR